MEICVAGWYFDSKLLRVMDDVNKHSEHHVYIVSHLPSNNGDTGTIPFKIIPNIGLEFGCYDYYLKEVWDGSNDVLFMHDDTEIKSASVFDSISKLDLDCAYIFRDMAEERANGGKHGRAIFCSKEFLGFLRQYECVCSQSEDREDAHHNPGTILKGQGPHIGFWYDKDNKGHIAGKPPVGIRHYNDAIYHFHWTLGRIRDQRCGEKEGWPNPKVKMNVVNRVMFSDMVAGHRGCYKHIEREQARYGGVKPKPKKLCPHCGKEIP